MMNRKTFLRGLATAPALLLMGAPAAANARRWRLVNGPGAEVSADARFAGFGELDGEAVVFLQRPNGIQTWAFR